MGNGRSKENLYTDVQITSPQYGFSMYYPPANYGYFDTSNRIKCCHLEHAKHGRFLNEGFRAESYDPRLNVQQRLAIPRTKRWVTIGYIQKPFRIDNETFPLQARTVVPGRLYEYRVYGPYGQYHGVKQTHKISNGDTIEVWTLKGTVTTWRARMKSNKWTRLLE